MVTLTIAASGPTTLCKSRSARQEPTSKVSSLSSRPMTPPMTLTSRTESVSPPEQAASATSANSTSSTSETLPSPLPTVLQAHSEAHAGPRSGAMRTADGPTARRAHNQRNQAFHSRFARLPRLVAQPTCWPSSPLARPRCSYAISSPSVSPRSDQGRRWGLAGNRRSDPCALGGLRARSGRTFCLRRRRVDGELSPLVHCERELRVSRSVRSWRSGSRNCSVGRRSGPRELIPRVGVTVRPGKCIDHAHQASLERTRCDQAQRDLVLGLPEQAISGTEHHRVDQEAQLVPPAPSRSVPARGGGCHRRGCRRQAPFALGRRPRPVVAQDGRAPGQVREPRGDDVLRQLVQPVGELTFRSGPEGMHGLVGDPAEQEASAFCACSSWNRSLSAAVEVHGPAPVPEWDVRGARRLHDPVERDVLAHGDLSHLFLLLSAARLLDRLLERGKRPVHRPDARRAARRSGGHGGSSS